jgi:hypothetical protein
MEYASYPVPDDSERPDRWLPRDRALSDLIDHAEHNSQHDPAGAPWWRLVAYQLTGLIPEPTR